MTNRQRFNAVLNYEDYDALPVVHFGYWPQTLEKWVAEGHLTADEIAGYDDNTEADRTVGKKLGFDFNFFTTYQDFSGFYSLWPKFEPKRLGDHPGGGYRYLNEYGAIVLQKDGLCSIEAEVGHTLVDRASWTEHYLPRLQFGAHRYDDALEQRLAAESGGRAEPLGLYCKSLYGQIRNWLGIEGMSYLLLDDEELFDEILETVCGLSYNIAKRGLESGIQFDFAHFWEDICFKNGPLVNPRVFREKVGPHYRRITDLVKSYGVKIISLDCDGLIDSLLPVWFENGVNTMFPIEVGTWGASIAPWREKYGRGLRGVGGLNKHVMAQDKAAVDAEIERMKPLVALGGFLPCPDHRIAPDAEWALVQYYCDRMRRVFGG